MMHGYQMLTFSIASVKPTARASMLVATLSIIRFLPFDGFCFASLLFPKLS